MSTATRATGQSGAGRRVRGSFLALPPARCLFATVPSYHAPGGG